MNFLKCATGGWLLVSWLLATASLKSHATPPVLEVGFFSCDVTPPLGHPLCGGWIKPLEAVEEPLLAKGVILSDGKQRYVLCGVDWCLLQTEACDLVRNRVARAAGVPEAQVAIQTIHQHNAPIADIRAQQLLDALPSAPPHLDLNFMQKVADTIAASVSHARRGMKSFDQIGYGKGRVENFASNRRVRFADGEIHVRYSSTTDAALHAAPEGLIDPWLRTITFYAGNQPLGRLHYYASHPQSYYGDGRATSDTVGLARQRLEREEGIPQIYFTGCAGNITAGKYNDGSPRARTELTERIYEGMKQSVKATEKVSVDAMSWKSFPLQLAPRSESEWSATTSLRRMADTNASATVRLSAALNLAWLEKLKSHPTIDVSRLRLGPVNILNLPGEAFVEYQLYAQGLLPDGFVAVAAYGDGGPGYICTDSALKEGGYEPTDSRVGPPSEFRMKQAIDELLRPRALGHFSPAYADKHSLLEYRDKAGRELPIQNSTEWEKRRTDILANLQLAMGPLPKRARLGPLNVRLLEESPGNGYIRRKITFDADKGDAVFAYLLLPQRLPGKAPAMLCLHQTTPSGKEEPAGLSGSPNLYYAEELARRGYVTLSPDYPNFGEYKVDAYAKGYASTTMKGIWNHMRAVDLLQSMPEVEPRRIGVIGHSLGGHNALFLAAFDTRVKAVITSCGFDSFFTYKHGDLTGWSHAGYMPRIATLYQKDPKLVPFDFSEILGAIAPRPVFINAPLDDTNFTVSGVEDCVIAAWAVYQLLGAADRLLVQHPKCGHDFIPETRKAAYEWLDGILKNHAQPGKGRGD